MASPKIERKGCRAALKSTSVAVAIAALAACGGGGGGSDAPAASAGPSQPTSSPGAPVATGTPVPTGTPTAPGTGSTSSTAPGTGTGGTGPATGTPAGSTAPATPVGGGTPAPVAFQRTDFQVNTQVAGSQGGANVARLASGGYVVAWDSSTVYGSSEIHLQRLDAQGQAAGAEQLVASNGRSAQVTAFANGNFLVTWTLSPFMYQADARAQMFDAQGTAVGAPMLLGSGFNSYVPRPMALPDGTFLAAIDTESGKYTPSYGLLQRFGADGTPLGDATRLESELSVQMTAYSPNSAGQARTALLADGRIAAVWLARGTGISELRLTLLDGQAVRLADRTLVSGAAPLVALPAITALPGGGAVVAWVAGTYDQPKTAFIALLDASGALGTPRVLATADANVDLAAVRLATLVDGNVVATWSTAVNDAAGQRQRQAFAQRFSGSSGTPLGAVLPIDTASSDEAVDTLFPIDSLDVTATTGSGFLALYGRWSAQQSWDVRATVR